MSEGKWETVWCKYDGQFTVETGKSLGLSPSQKLSKIEHFVPVSQLGKVNYAEGGDSMEIHKDRTITGLQLPRWLAERLKLEIDE